VTLITNAFAVGAGTIATAALGYPFWALAARNFPPADVGFAAAFVSAMTLLGSVGVLGLHTFVIAEIPRSRGREAELVAAAMGGAGLASAALATVFAIVTPLLSPNLSTLAAPLPMAVFAVGVGLTAASMVLDQALVGLLRPRLQFGRNVLFGVSKLVALALAGYAMKDGGGLVIAATWVTGTMIGTLPVVALFAERRRVRTTLVQHLTRMPLRARFRAVLSHHTLNVGLQFTHLSLPILVTAILSATENAYFYVAWMLASMVFLGSAALTVALYAVGVRERDSLARHARFTLALGLSSGMVAMVVLFFASDLVLGLLFGSVYPEQAGPTLRILTVAACPLVIVDHFIALTRIQGRTLAAAGFVWPMAIAQLGLAAVGGKLGGLPGLSLGWVTGVSIEALIMCPFVFRTTELPLAFRTTRFRLARIRRSIGWQSHL
jgi:O-antigen/teichoic acid export membrane protein